MKQKSNKHWIGPDEIAGVPDGDVLRGQPAQFHSNQDSTGFDDSPITPIVASCSAGSEVEGSARLS